jgi:hypothetical protein
LKWSSDAKPPAPSRHRNRTGELSAEQLVAILIVLLAGIAVMVVFIGVRRGIDGVQEGVCAGQVRAAAKTQQVFGREYQVNVPACQTKYMTIKRDELPGNDEQAREAVKKRLAEEMRKCWHQWGRGELDLFGSEGEYCSFCSDVSFDEKTKALFSRGYIEGFHKYLSETTAPGQDVTYSEYLAGIQRSEDGNDIRQTVVGDLSLKANYTILFTYSKMSVTDNSLQYWGNFFGADLSPAKQAKISAVAVTTGVGAVGVISTAATIGGLVGTYGGAAGTAAGVLAAGGPVGWTVLGGAVAIGAVVTAGYLGYRALTIGYGAVKVGAAAGALTYISARNSDDFFIISATYIIPTELGNSHIRNCNRMAEPTRSP